jgi:VWFA-related protein
MTRLAIVAALVAATGQTSVFVPQTRFRTGVDLVRLDVSVMRGRQPVRGLTARDFSIVDSGVRQRIESVSLLDALPVSVLMVLDTSGSVAGERLGHLIDAGRGLLAALRPGDRAGLITFSQDVRVRVPLTIDRSTLQSALTNLTGDGPTAIRDAVWAALQLCPDDDSRPLVLVFTDGVDNASWLSRSDILTGTRRAGVVIHVVELSGDQPQVALSRRTSPPPTFLEALVDAAGGRRWSATSLQDLGELFTGAIDEMRARYLVTFYPEGVRHDGWHELKVSVNARGDVTTRPGYFVAPRD